MKAGEVKAGTVCLAVEQVPLVRARHSVDSCFPRNDSDNDGENDGENDGDNDNDDDNDNDGDGEEVRREGFCLIGDS